MILEFIKAYDLDFLWNTQELIISFGTGFGIGGIAVLIMLMGIVRFLIAPGCVLANIPFPVERKNVALNNSYAGAIFVSYWAANSSFF